MDDGSVHFHFENIETISFSEADFEGWVSKCISTENKKLGTISCVFCSDDYLLEINKTYLSHDTLTDIVTFNYVENEVISGDLFISLDRIKENANTFNVSFSHELKRVIVHGVLHLIGFNDKTPEEAKEIRAKEDFYLTLSPD